MTQCIVYDETTKESETFCSLTAAKKWMRERIKQKHEVSGQKYRVYSDGEFVNCGFVLENHHHALADAEACAAIAVKIL